MAASDATRDELVREVQHVVYVGAHRVAPVAVPNLLRLARSYITGVAEATEPISSLLSAAIAILGDSAHGRAAQELLGLDDSTRSAKLGVRQEAAAAEIPISARQFRRPGSYQDAVIHAVVAGIEQLAEIGATRSRPRIDPHLAAMVHVREARRADRQFVLSLMVSALAPYYGGDHEAHAVRIFSTHIDGGEDKLGFFSREQRMFLATLGSEPAAPRLGLLHLVGKRQGTYKISPLIVAPEVRGRLRVGPSLLAFADLYARERGSRALYCTVAEDNKQAVQFFVRSGFVIAGRSDSHYRPDGVELMLYKLLSSADNQSVFDGPNISVTPMERAHRDAVRGLLLSVLPTNFEGIDESWVDALFAGHERRGSVDVNQKFKLIYVATDRANTVLGVAAATPKKGEPIKVMPLLAKSVPAFAALITDLPFLLRPYGRKLYAHLEPNAEETIVLQARGWRLDAALPSAYREAHTTQQWSLNIDSEDFMRTMRVKQRYLDYIKAGTKPLEVRVGYDSIKSIKAGERIRLASRDDSQVVVVRDVRAYDSFDEMAMIENLSHVVPGQRPAAVLKTLKEIYPPSREQLGVIVLNVEPVDG